MIRDTIDTSNDPLSSALMKMKLHGFVSVAFDAGGNWGIDFPAYEGFRLNVVQKGEAWLTVEGERTRYLLKTGDCVLLASGVAFSLAKDLHVKRKTKARDLLETLKNGVVTCNGGGDFLSLGTVFEFEGHLPQIIFAQMPSVIHIPGNSDQAAILKWSLERFVTEFQNNQIGKPLILNHLAPIMLLQVLRIYMNSKSFRSASWLSSLSDPKLVKSIHAMQSRYQKNWSLTELAKTAGMSRSGFALNFKKNVGVAPMDYLTHWRMQIACDLLQSGQTNVAEIANAVGYSSASAFSVAFKKIKKLSPGSFQKSSSNSSAS